MWKGWKPAPRVRADRDPGLLIYPSFRGARDSRPLASRALSVLAVVTLISTRGGAFRRQPARCHSEKQSSQSSLGLRFEPRSAASLVKNQW